MFSESVSLPFSIKKVHNGFSRLEGIAKVSETGLTLEYEIKVLRMLRLPVKEFTVPLAEIESVQLKKNWFTTRLVIRTRSLRALSRFPGSQQAQIRLCIPRIGRKTAERIVSLLTLYVSDYLLQSMLNEEENRPPHRMRNAQNSTVY